VQPDHGSMRSYPFFRVRKYRKLERGGGAFGLRRFVVDRNICHFLWYGVGAGEGLRSVGAASPSKSVYSILPLARHLRAGVPTLDPGLYNVLGRVLPVVSETRPSPLCALCALHGTSGGATMITPGGAGTPRTELCNYPRARRIGFYHGPELSVYLTPAFILPFAQ
jgi:hypothetical protein